MNPTRFIFAWLCTSVLAATVWSNPLPIKKIDTSRGDQMLAAYFKAQTERLREDCLADIDTLEDWQKKRGEYRRQLLEMLGLDPLPPRTELNASITNKTESEDFIVEQIHFQSRPGLYVTANLYRPKKVEKPLPAILYVCGHGGVKKDGVSYGNKVHYHHHGSWFARNGYVCLTIDSLQLGEIEAIHHGTYRYDMWWWHNRGYTPAGVEAWNCIRALDYLQTRAEVDADRIGVTGRSGGGAYSWWISAIDERIKCAVPVAGITDLQNHVVDGTVEGHCDCMFMVNTYRWDYPLVAALVAPRPLLISNTDNDGIFPLDGVIRTHAGVRKVYDLYGAKSKLALHITAGPHKDTQELRVHAFRWFNHYLKGDSSLIEKVADKFFEPSQLKVFDKLPDNETNTTIHESFVAAAAAKQPESESHWKSLRNDWRQALKEKSFRGWPDRPDNPEATEAWSVQRHGLRFRAYDFESQPHIRLRLYLVHREGVENNALVVVNVLDQKSWGRFLAAMRVGFEAELKGEFLPEADKESFESERRMHQAFKWAMVYVPPRGIGPTAWNQDNFKQTQHRRRFALLGQTLDGMRVWDVRRAIQTLRSLNNFKETPLWLQGHDRMAGVALYASLFEPNVKRLDLHGLPKTHRTGPFFLNVRKTLDMPQAVAMAAERSRVVIYQQGKEGWKYPAAIARQLGWKEKQLQLRPPVTAEN
ncbi:MAG: prolyl oligopeptidase family serine peptidase [Planctomycetota bacterium]|nr:prolyl oligopeptidase family serine peptidase [Planctomycetota bacterium]